MERSHSFSTSHSLHHKGQRFFPVFKVLFNRNINRSLFNVHITSWGGAQLLPPITGSLQPPVLHNIPNKLQLKIPPGITATAIHGKSGRETQYRVLWYPPNPGHGCSQSGAGLPFTHMSLTRRDKEHTPHL